MGDKGGKKDKDKAVNSHNQIRQLSQQPTPANKQTRQPVGSLQPAVVVSRQQSTAPSYPLAAESPRGRLRFTRIR